MRFKSLLNNSPETSPSGPASTRNENEHWKPVALLLRPQGRRGELLADPLTDLMEVFASGSTLRLATSPEAAAEAESVILESSWQPQGRNAARMVLKLAGIDTISAAEALEGKSLFLAASQWPALADGTFLVGDLLGCTFFNDGQRLGTVTDLQFPIGPDGRTRVADAADLLVVQREASSPEAEPVLVPFISAWLQRVDLEAREIHMTLPEGLFDAAED